MFYRIPDEFLLYVKKVKDMNLVSSEYRGDEIEEEDIFKEADEDYISESIEE